MSEATQVRFCRGGVVPQSNSVWPDQKLGPFCHFHFTWLGGGACSNVLSSGLTSCLTNLADVPNHWGRATGTTRTCPIATHTQACSTSESQTSTLFKWTNSKFASFFSSKWSTPLSTAKVEAPQSTRTRTYRETFHISPQSTHISTKPVLRFEKETLFLLGFRVAFLFGQSRLQLTQNFCSDDVSLLSHLDLTNQ